MCTRNQVSRREQYLAPCCSFYTSTTSRSVCPRRSVSFLTTVYCTEPFDITYQLQLQEDLNALTTWANTWACLSSRPCKCYILTTSQNRWINTFLYYLCGCVLSKVPTSKYLSVTQSEDLQWNAHIKTICVSASRTLGFL